MAFHGRASWPLFHGPRSDFFQAIPPGSCSWIHRSKRGASLGCPAIAGKSTSTVKSEFTGTIGLPLPSTYISIRDDDGKEVPIGEAAEICGKGPQVMAGYWKRPDETALVMTSDGFFRTGDIGVMSPDGFT